MIKNIEGKKFGYLKAIQYSHRSKRATGGWRNYWVCECICGKEIKVDHEKLIYKRQLSCGCKKGQIIRARKLIHGQSKSKHFHKNESSEYKTWCHMKYRCENPLSKAYPYYGLRGIKVCNEWKHSFETFLKDMGKKPTPKHSINRIDNNGNYELSNCHWATAKQQASNRGPRRDAVAMQKFLQREHLRRSAIVSTMEFLKHP